MKVAKQRTLKLSALAALAGGSALASAQVYGYDAFRTQYFTQTSDSAPTTPDSYQFFARIFLTNQADADAGTLTDPNNNSYSMPQYLLDPILNTYYLFYGDSSATSQAQEDANYPSGTYTYTLNGGTNGYDGNQATLNMGPDDFSTTVPYLTGGTYSGLQGMDPTKSVSLSWNDYIDPLGNSTHQTFLVVYDLTTGGNLVYNNNGASSSYTGDTIAAGTFQSGNQYEYTLYFSSRFFQGSGITDPTNAFYGTTWISSSDLGTSGLFTPAPEPMTVAGLAIGALALARRRRR